MLLTRAFTCQHGLTSIVPTPSRPNRREQRKTMAGDLVPVRQMHSLVSRHHGYVGRENGRPRYSPVGSQRPSYTCTSRMPEKAPCLRSPSEAAAPTPQGSLRPGTSGVPIGPDMSGHPPLKVLSDASGHAAQMGCKSKVSSFRNSWAGRES